MISNSKKIFTILACSFFFSACNHTPPKAITTNEDKTAQIQGEQGLKGKFSFKTLLTQNKSLTCTYKFTDEENKFEITGVSYISGKKVLQQTQTTNLVGDKKMVDGSVYTDGDYIYIWNPSDKTSGLKMKVENQQEEQSGVKTDIAGAQESMEKEYDLDCMPWKVDEKVFLLPADIIFKDFSQMMNSLPTIPQIPNMPKQ